MVAALVKVPEGESEGENWILAEVVSYNPQTNTYEVEDILKEQNQKARHILHKRYVVPLPLMRANPETDPGALFPTGTLGKVSQATLYEYINAYEVYHWLYSSYYYIFKWFFRISVLALFPQTTCFYKAIVNKLPATHTDKYELLFEDTNYAEGYSAPTYIFQRYVIAFKQRKQASWQEQSDSFSDSENSTTESSN